MKKLIPPFLRLKLRVIFIRFKDILSLRYWRLVKKDQFINTHQHQISLRQPIRKNEYSENKKHNLRLAIQKIENLEILPLQIFSFWNLIPPPLSKNGFKKGRNLVGNELALDYGGGLCQLSGIIYHLVLEAGIEILERHPHSLDIYTEATRYTPMGSDATVVYGHKDLRFINNLGFPISFQFEILENEIVLFLCANQKIKKNTIEFLVEQRSQGKLVEVIRHRDGKREVCSQDFYKNLTS